MYVAHKSDDGRTQTVDGHLSETAGLAGKFAGSFGAEEYGYCVGELHDAGKYSQEFQKHILQNGPKADHSTAGAQAVLKASPSGVGKILAYCAAGHHSGLPDGAGESDSTLSARLKRRVPDFSPFYREVDLPDLLPKLAPPIHMIGNYGFTASFFIRMLFSCLVDADFLDTERFVSDREVDRGAGESIPALYAKLRKHLAKFRNPTNDLNIRRSEILQTCLRKAPGPKGLYTLTVPTGGGKTLSSLAFALRHAVEHGMNRVIYAIPYTSIIEQNAAVFRDILGDENVLEHQSNFAFPNCEEEHESREQEKLKLASENWDAPLIVTTNVQLFDSLFANRSSRCRKLHNIAGSVIIFDEAQMIPREYLQPCIRAISELVLNYGCTAVLCSATQPALEGLFPPEVQSTEICENIPETYEFFRRTRMVQAGELDDETLARELGAQKQVLCIVNTKKHAQELYLRLKREGSFHLSTLMTPAHRKRVLNEIRERLKDGRPCWVVSTSLIEAGVDVDFPAVYREEAGLDSEIQAAGRCNRENRRPAEESRVVIFRSEEKYRRHLPVRLKTPIDITQIAAGKYEDIASPEAIRCYFETMYRVSGDQLDKENIVEQFERGAADNFNFPFATVADKFHLIDTEQKSILVAKEPEAQALLLRLRAGARSRELFRALNPYCVNVYPPQFQSLYDMGKIELLDGELAVLADLDVYSEETGLSVQSDSGIAYIV
ncbi:MAG TPA: CRISPR-associated helicase Cas3' [Caproiciproducens sp.]|nr:CRISPR-associated helicase Cas3' [Caproiciproducens sp.]